MQGWTGEVQEAVNQSFCSRSLGPRVRVSHPQRIAGLRIGRNFKPAGGFLTAILFAGSMHRGS